nr:2-hydroxyacyl-CoA dehydratase [Campylobacter concisus]
MYSPKELIYVTGAVLISLCTYGESPINTTHAEFPRNLFPLIKASYGYTVTKKYPYMNASDIIIGKITCYGKNKIYKLLRSACPRTSKYDKKRSLEF